MAKKSSKLDPKKLFVISVISRAQIAELLNDDAIMAMVKVLGSKKFGVALDLALGGNRYGKKATDEARKAMPAAA